MAREKKKRSGVDLTQGSIPKGIAAFAVPLLFTSVVQQLYSTVDLLFVGNFLGTEAAAALGISTLLITCLVGLLTGVSVGVNVVVGQLFGAKDFAQVDRGVHTAWMVGLIGGVVLALFGFFFAPTYISLMETPDSVVEGATQYLRIYFIAMVVVSLYNMQAGISRALGDSTSPMWAQTIGGLMNVGANWVFICFLGWGITGAAVATLLSNGVATVFLAWRLHTIQVPYRLRFSALCLDGALAGRVLKVGLPMGFQSMIVTLSNVIMQHQIDLMGVSAIAAFTTYFKVELPIYYGVVAVGQATTTFVSQNHGACNHVRMRKGAFWCQWIAVGLSIVVGAIMLAAGWWAFWIFNQDPQVIELGLKIIWISFPLYSLYSVLEVQGDVMRGLGHSTVPALIVLLNICIVRTALVMALTTYDSSVTSVAIAYPISWATAAICMIVARVLVERKEGHPVDFHRHTEEQDFCPTCGKPIDPTHHHGADVDHLATCSTCDGHCDVLEIHAPDCDCEDCRAIHNHPHTHVDADGHTYTHTHAHVHLDGLEDHNHVHGSGVIHTHVDEDGNVITHSHVVDAALRQEENEQALAPHPYDDGCACSECSRQRAENNLHK